MSRYRAPDMDDGDPTPGDPGADEDADDADLWFLPGPSDDGSDPFPPDSFPPGPRPDPVEADIVDAWRAAEAGHAARLARVAARLGRLDERLRRGPAGWRHRLALIEAAELSWLTLDRIGLDRLSLYMALRVSTATDDAQSLYRMGWTVRRLSGGNGPLEPDADVAALETFLDRRDRPGQGAPVEDATVLLRVRDMAEREAFTHRAAAWIAMMRQAGDLHPVSRACMGFHLWHVAGISPIDDPLEAAVTAARVAVGDLVAMAAGHGAGAGPGAVFAPLAMGGAGGFRTSGDPAARLARWCDATESAVVAALRRLDEIDTWDGVAQVAMARLSGRTPPRLRAVFVEWPLVSAQMAERISGAHRATVQRNIDWMVAQGLIREITGQARCRMWRIVAQGLGAGSGRRDAQRAGGTPKRGGPAQRPNRGSPQVTAAGRPAACPHHQCPLEPGDTKGPISTA